MAKLTPRFRKELPASATETDGVPCVLVTDPQTGTSFTFYEFEYDLAHQLDGQDVDDVIMWAAANYQTALTAEAIDEFAAKLAELGFLETGPAPAGATPAAPSVPVDSSPTFMGFAGSGARAPAPRDTSGATELSSDSLVELAESGAVGEAIAAATTQPISSSGVPRAIGTSSGTFSRGFSERRQPPPPGEVVMTPFEDVSMRFRAPPPERQRSSTGLVVAFLLVVVAGGGGGYYYWMRQHPKAPEALRIRVVSPQPTAVYRWFATPGSIVDLDARTLSFESAGKVVELMPTGTKFAAGDILGKLQGAESVEGDLAKLKSKLSVFTQMRDSMKASGNKANLRDAEDKVAARKKMVDDVQASLAKLVLRAPEAGAIIDTTVKVGALVPARGGVIKWRGRSLHGDFTMDQEDFAKASKLEFCRVEVAGIGMTGTTNGSQTPTVPVQATGSGPAPVDAGGAAASAISGELRYVDCTLPPPAPPPVNGVPSLLRKFIVTLPNDAGLVAGQQLHLARRRYDGVFPVPVSAVQTVTDVEARVWVVGANRTAEQRTITVAESRDEVLVSAGINVGDEIIVEPPHELAWGTLLEPIR